MASKDNKKAIRIWVNHWFSTVFYIIKLFKESEYISPYVIGTNEHSVCVYKSICDEWHDEPVYDPLTYGKFCLDFCKEHSVDLFVVKRGMREVLALREEFESLGVKLFAESDIALVAEADDKEATYLRLRDVIGDVVPDYRVAHSLAEFEGYYEELSASYRVCYKLIRDEGAASFRVIDNTIEGIGGLRAKPGSKITLEAAKKVLGGYDFSVPVLMMPYLAGVEISADCLATPRGNIILPRYKVNKRYSEVVFDPDVVECCERIMNAIGYTMPVNIQFKYDKDKFYLLEINTRMSGGLPLTVKATGMNIPAIAMEKLYGIDSGYEIVRKSLAKVVHLETPVEIE